MKAASETKQPIKKYLRDSASLKGKEKAWLMSIPKNIKFLLERNTHDCYEVRSSSKQHENMPDFMKAKNTWNKIKYLCDVNDRTKSVDYPANDEPD